VDDRIAAEAGRVTVAGMTGEVSFEPVEGPILTRIDEAHRIKYRTSDYLLPMIGQRPRGATVRIVPRETKEKEKNDQ